MKKKIPSLLFLLPMAAFAAAANETAAAVEDPAPAVSLFACADLASDFIAPSGWVTDNDPVLQFYAQVDTRVLGGSLPIEGYVWGNYGLRDNPSVRNVDRGFDEVDFSVSSPWKLDGGWKIHPAFTVWTYPNRAVRSVSSELVECTVSKTLGPAALGCEAEYILHGGSERDLRVLPFASVRATFAKGLSLSLKGQGFWRADHDNHDGWGNVNVQATLSCRAVSLYVRHWFEIDEDVTTNGTRDLADTVYGISFSCRL